MNIRLSRKISYLYGILLCLVLLLGLTGCGMRKMAGIDPVAGGIDTEVEVTKDDIVDNPASFGENEQSEASEDQVQTADDPTETADHQEEIEKDQAETEDDLIDADSETSSDTEVPETPAIDEDGTYSSKDDVALYIHTYGKLPSNYITKKEAEKLGWSGGSLEPYAPGKCIGGSYFGNYEGKLPEAAGREYHECDIDTLGKKSRGAKRIVYSNDGLIYYTDDHYETFTLLY